MSYVEYAYSELQVRIAKALDDKQSIPGWAKENGMDVQNAYRAVRKIKSRAAKKGFAPEHDMTKTAPDGFTVKRTATLYDADGVKKIQWVMANQDAERQLEIMREAIVSLSEDLPKIPATPTPNKAQFNAELMAVYPLGDPHIGMLSWGEETGQDWDLKIAEEKFCGVFDRLVKTAPKCDQAVIINLGDYFHADNMEGTTTRSGHSLDMDGRFTKMIRVGVKIMRRMIDSALMHHNTVRVINAVGNHDDTGSLFLSVALANMYEKEPRITVDDAPTPFHYVQFGQSMFGVHHGHTCKHEKLPGVMAADQPVMWGQTKHRYWYTGHVHHDTKKEFAGVTVESFRTLAARDAYATWGGYRSGQDSKCIVLHSEHGEVERHTVNVAMG